MTSLDIAFFPHIFDTIYAFVEFEAHLLLRLTCRALRDRIDGEWERIRWNVDGEEGQSDTVYNKRGCAIPTDSPYLRLAKVLDLNGEDSDECSGEVPEYLRPEIIRVLGAGNYSMFAYAKAMIVFDPVEAYLLDSYLCNPVHGHINSIYRLHLPPTRARWEMTDVFEDPWTVPCGADVYYLLSGLDPSSSCEAVDALFRCIMDSLTAERSGEEDGQFNFHFVDIPSWFDASCTAHPSDDPNRLDNFLTNYDTLYGYLLKCARPRLKTWQTEEDLADWWPSPKIRRRLSQVHCITREEMRERVGDKAYDLTFAPQDMCAPRTG